MENFTEQDFNRELLTFRELMGDKRFWAKPEWKRQIAIKALGVVYANTPPSDRVLSHFEAALLEYTKRETLMLRAGLTTIDY